MRLFYHNIGTNTLGLNQKPQMLTKEIKDNLINEIGNKKPDVIVLSEYSNSGEDILSFLTDNDYCFEISNENSTKSTCLILIAWKKHMEGKQCSERPGILEDRFLRVSLNNGALQIVGIHVPAAYPYNSKIKDASTRLRSLKARIEKEIEPFRQYICNLDSSIPTILIGDFNPYNLKNYDLQLLKLKNPNMQFTDNALELSSNGWKSLFFGPTFYDTYNNIEKQLDFGFSSLGSELCCTVDISKTYYDHYTITLDFQNLNLN